MQLKSFFQKFAACFILGITLSADVLLVGRDKRPIWISPAMVFGLAGLCFFASIIYAIVWYFKTKSKEEDLPQKSQFILDFIRYALAFNVASFGWKKIFGQQFVVPQHIADIPMSQQSGEWLTWFYFGHSYPFACIVASMQIVGSLLFLFRKTQMLGLFVLLPVMLNILLINVFYEMNGGALMQSVVLVIGVLYFLLLEWNKLMLFFFQKNKEEASLSISNNPIKNIVRFSAIVLALLFVYRLENNPKQNEILIGSYDIKSLKVNNKAINVDSCIKDSTLTKIYFDLGDVCVLEFNRSNRRKIGHYDFDNAQKQIKVMFEQSPEKIEVLTAKLVQLEDLQQMLMLAKMGNDSLQITLQKLK